MTMWSVLLAPSADPVLTLAQAKLRAGLDWADGDPRDELMADFVATATSKVERDTELALMPQSRLVFVLGAMPSSLVLPPFSRPLQSVAGITYIDLSGVTQDVDPATYTIDQARGVVQLVAGAVWPTADLAYPWEIEILAGYAEAATIPPLLYQAVGILTAHLATFGRDLISAQNVVGEVPYGYDDCVATYRPVIA